jgi:hypothetical protein
MLFSPHPLPLPPHKHTQVFSVSGTPRVQYSEYFTITLRYPPSVLRQKDGEGFRSAQ